jgi:predicted GNAT family acetyltransferase
MENIKHRHTEKGGSFYYEQDGKQLAEMVYVMAGEKQMIIEHTEVDDSLRGQGIGKKLQAALVDYVRANGIKVIPLCPFAKATFQKMKEWEDVLA